MILVKAFKIISSSPLCVLAANINLLTINFWISGLCEDLDGFKSYLTDPVIFNDSLLTPRSINLDAWAEDWARTSVNFWNVSRDKKLSFLYDW